MALVLLLLPWAWALVQVLRHHQLDSGAVGIVAGLSVGLPALWLAWVGYLEASRSGTRVGELSLEQVADGLAVAVGAQWETEAAIRRLNDPYPLPVSWGPAEASLTQGWDSLVTLAERGAGWPAPPSEGTWAAGPDGLAGADRDLVNVLARVPTGRLVVLGEWGAGKTILMVRLVLDLLERRAAGGPVPILASIASWDPADQDLRDWLAAQLLTDHPALAAPPPTGRQEPTLAAALLASGLLLMVLDGLDEIPEDVRGPAISRINYALRPGEQVVVTCRSQQYRDAVRPQGGTEVTLLGAAAVQLNPLDAKAVRTYLCPATSDPHTKDRWDPVLNVLGTTAPAGQALETPLMVGLARAIYSPRPGELAGELPEPKKLCDLADRAAVESRLFDAFISAAYQHGPAGRWKTEDVERWLVFLAKHLDQKLGETDLAWWRLRSATPGPVIGLAAGLGAAVVGGLLGGLGAVGHTGGLAAALMAGLGVGLAIQLIRFDDMLATRRAVGPIHPAAS